MSWGKVEAVFCTIAVVSCIIIIVAFGVPNALLPEPEGTISQIQIPSYKNATHCSFSLWSWNTWGIHGGSNDIVGIHVQLPYTINASQSWIDRSVWSDSTLTNENGTQLVLIVDYYESTSVKSNVTGTNVAEYVQSLKPIGNEAYVLMVGDSR